jgi:phosphopantothenate synthetase
MTNGEKLEALLLNIIAQDESKSDVEREELKATVSDDFSQLRLLEKLAHISQRLKQLEMPMV